MHLADLLIHVHEKLGVTEQEGLEDDLRQVEGVIAPRFNGDNPHMLLVSYNPEATNSYNLLRKVTTKGYGAQLVAL